MRVGKIAPSTISSTSNEVTSTASEILAKENQYDQVIIHDVEEEITDKGQI